MGDTTPTRGLADGILHRLRRQFPQRGEKAPAICSQCDDTGWTYPNGPDGGVVRCPECDSRKRGQAPGVPMAEHGSRLDGFEETRDNRDALAQARRWLAGDFPDLYLFGGVGTGKTRLACSLVNERWAAGDRVEFIRAAQLLAVLLPASDSLDDAMARISRIPVVVLDDVGANQATDFARRMLLVLYETRMDRGHRTIWTSNLTLGELAEFHQDDRLSSRIVGNAKVVELAGKDWRLRKRRV
jgi:chromosomal replication initiation ATPase DnaA